MAESSARHRLRRPTCAVEQKNGVVHRQARYLELLERPRKRHGQAEGGKPSILHQRESLASGSAIAAGRTQKTQISN